MHVIDKIKKHRLEILKLAQEHGCCDVRIFGSVAREEETRKSDVDVLVNIKKGYSLLDMVGFQLDLEKLLHKKVDVVPEKALHWYIKKDVLKEAKPI